MRDYRRHGRRPSFPLIGLGLLVVALASGAAFDTTTVRGSAEVQVAADSVVLFGPVEFESEATGNPQYYVETFVDPNPSETAYLTITSDTTVELSPLDTLPTVPEGLAVTLNGTKLTFAPCVLLAGQLLCPIPGTLPEIFPPDSFRAGVTYSAATQSLLQAINTLEVEYDGSATFTLTMSVYRASSQRITVFGEETYERSGGATTVTDSFSLPTGTDPPYTMIVRNGVVLICGPSDCTAYPQGTDRAKDVRIWLNGSQVVDDNDLDVGTDSIFIPLTLQTENEIQVRVVKDNGSKVRVEVVAIDTIPPVLTVISPADSAVVVADSVQVTGTVSDARPVVVKANGHSAPVDLT